jgi:5'-nucleotidase/UDP-sugar diphosphatase
VVKVKMTGALLIEVLDFGKSKEGTGAYLQRYNLDESPSGAWLLEGNRIDANKTYLLAVSDFLMKGYDIPFLTPQNIGVLDIFESKPTEPATDIRKAVILYLKSIKK